MIVGSGDIASALPDRGDKIFFASGVSNSQETKASEYDREKKLLLKQHKAYQLVYFSSLSVFYSQTRYAQHKRFMEVLVKKHFPHYAIVRIGNIDWGTNPHTLINYLRAHPKAEIKDEWRYITDKAEFLHWINLIPDWNCEMNCPGRRLKVKEIWDIYVKK